MSPFLFILAIEGFNHMLKIAKRRWIRGFGSQTKKGSAMEISPLFYVDDSLVFCDAYTDQVRHVRVILAIFEGIFRVTCQLAQEFYIPC